MNDSPVQDAQVVEAPNDNIGNQKESPKESPAKDLREIQALLVNGIYPGNSAPAVVKAFHLLEAMAVQVENAAK